MNLPKKFNPEMLDERPNVGENLAFIHDFQIEEEFDCPSDCRNSAHHRLLNLDTRTEITTSFERIDAMLELWHGGN